MKYRDIKNIYSIHMPGRQWVKWYICESALQINKQNTKVIPFYYLRYNQFSIRFQKQKMTSTPFSILMPQVDEVPGINTREDNAENLEKFLEMQLFLEIMLYNQIAVHVWQYSLRHM